MAGETFNLGNVLMQAEQVNALRDRRDPNSPQNRLVNAQIGAAERKARGGYSPSGVQKEIEFYQHALRQNKLGNPDFPQQVVDLAAQAIAKHPAFLSNSAVGNASRADFTMNRSGAAGTAQGTLMGNEMMTPDFSPESVPRAQLDTGGASLVMDGKPLTKADQQARIKAAETQAQQDVRLATEPKIQGQITTAEGTAGRAQEYINTGLAAADSMPVIRRGIQLLEQGVKTGGLDNLKLWASDVMGVTGADEGELSANLGKAVLSQLRSTFGAQFTEREGARLERIEAGFGKSAAVNLRLLNQILQIAEKEAKRGIAAARSTGDDFTAQQIEEAMKAIVGPDAKTGANTNTNTGADGGQETYEQRKARILGQ